MKKTKHEFRIYGMAFAILMSTFLHVKAQVITRVLSSEDKIENYIPWYNPNERIKIVQTPLLDVEEVLEEDRRTGREMPRIGIKQDVNYNARDGQLIDYGNYSIWNLILYSENARSMSVRFENTTLPNDAVMFLYNKETRFVVGPISHKVFKNGMFRSDYLNGDKINISIFIPTYIQEVKNDFIQITTYDHGILPFSEYAHDDNFNTSQDCNVNVVCDEGNGWECQIESVCKIIHNTIGSCTGSLINNDCCDLTPYILTANHCVAGLPVDDYLFRFNYQSPQCNPSVEPNPSQWISYFGSIIRANWNGTDFSLLELNRAVGEGVSFAGWNRNVNPPTNVATCIHHPQGDVKKIAINNDGIATQGNFWLIDQWDVGLVEPGSSGSPLYDENQFIIGDLHGGDRNIGCIDGHGLVDNNTYGQFSISWEGNGTNNTSLRNWLGASTNPNTMDCMEHPFIEGPDVVCTSPKTFTLINNMPCAKDVEWRVEPTNLFASSFSGSGNSATIWAKPNVKGPATIIYTLTTEGCNPTTLEKDFWVGGPIMQEYFIHIGHCLARIFIKNWDPISQTTYTFFVRLNCSGSSTMQVYTINPGENAVNIPIPHGERCEMCVEGVFASNECGSIYSDERKCVNVSCREIIKDRSADNEKNEGYRNIVQIFPNPTNDIFNVQFRSIEDNSVKQIQILDLSGKVIESLSTNSNSISINISNYPQGLYFIQCEVGDKISHYKIFKQ